MTHRRTDESGAAMVMVLIVVVVVALVSTAFITKSGTELHAASVLQTKVNLQYGADAGLEHGVKVLSTELASANRTHCLTPVEGPQSIASFSWSASGFPATTTCETLQGEAADSNLSALYGAAIITTGGAGSLQTQSAVNTSLDVGGVIYISGAETSNDLKKLVTLTKGDLAIQGCVGTPAVSQITVTAPYKQYCTALTPAQVAPSITLPSVPTTALAPVTLPGNKCRIFFPGKYTSAPALLSGNNTANYLASGDYYFDGDFTIHVGNNVTVVAGAPSPGDVTPAGVSACSDDVAVKLLAGAAAGAITSTGAAFFMGGASALSVAQGSIVMYSRPITAGYTIPLSVYAVRPTDTGWDAWSGGASQVVGNTNPNASMLFNGQINAYTAPVTLFASNPSYAVARAGVIAKILNLQASASGTGLDVSGYGTAPTAGFRIVRLVSHLAGTVSDGGAADGTAVVKFPNDLSAPTVLSWRFS